MADCGALVQLLEKPRGAIFGLADLAARMHTANRVLTQIFDDRQRRPLWRVPGRLTFGKRTVEMPYRLERSSDAEVTGAIDTASGLVGVFDGRDGDVRYRR
jgi:hypothetical protein